MSKITLNIGLNVGATEPQNQLSATLAALVAAGFVVVDTRIVTGEWQGVTERTLVAVVHRVKQFTYELSLLCRSLNQEVIAYYDPDANDYLLVNTEGELSAGERNYFNHIGFYLPAHKGKRYPCGAHWALEFHEGERAPESATGFF